MVVNLLDHRDEWLVAEIHVCVRPGRVIAVCAFPTHP